MSTRSAAVGDSAPDSSSPMQMAHAPGRLSAWDYVGMLAGFLLTLAITVVNSRGRVFWEDESLGWMLLTDPSWRHMIRAWNLGADGGGFSFYVFGRAWFAVFGNSHLAFRLFSSTCFGIAFVALWGALRRNYPTWTVAFAAFNTFFFSPPLTRHFLEGRFYGLLVMASALALWLVLTLNDTPDPTPARFYLGGFLIHGMLTTSHLLGVVFSAFLLAATVILDRLRGRRRFRLYLTIAAAWLLLLPEKTSIASAARVGKPHFWTKPPKIADLIGAYSGFSHEILIVLVLLAIGTLLVLRRSPGGVRTALRRAYHQRQSVYVATVCLLLVPVSFLIEGLLSTWLFTDRYLQPVAIGIAFITAEFCLLLSHNLDLPLASRMPRLVTFARCAFGLLFAGFTFIWVFHHIAQQTPSPPDFTPVITEHMPKDLPVVIEDAFTFTELMDRQSHSGVQYMFLLDWPWAISPAAPRLEPTQYHLMENWKRAGYFADRIENVDDFLRKHRRFLLVHDAGIHPAKGEEVEIGNPLEERLTGTSHFELHKVFTLDRVYHDGVRDTVWLACQGGCNAQSNPIQGATYCVRYAPKRVCCNNHPCLGALPAAVKKAIE